VDQITSPDLPAYICYLIVLAVGMIVARASVQMLLASQRGYWGIANTWALFWAYAAIPVILFWFLDYSSALRDTSLYAALIVAYGYRQIFTGGVQGIVAPGQTARLWQPFEAWASRISEAVASRNKSSQDLFNENVRTYLASDPARLQELLRVAFLHTKDWVNLAAELAALASKTTPSAVPAPVFAQWKDREQARILISDLRAAQPENYGVFLYQEKLISRWMLVNWREGWRSRSTARTMLAVIILVFCVGAWTWYRSDGVQLWYYHWRFTKANASDLDRFRSKEYLGRRLQMSPRAGSTHAMQIDAVLGPLVDRLRFKGLSQQVADDALRLVINFHSLDVNVVVIPHLIAALRTENPDVRLRIKHTLIDLQKSEYSQTPPDEATNWEPTKDESPGDIDRHVQAWQAWWKSAQQPPAGNKGRPSQ